MSDASTAIAIRIGLDRSKTTFIDHRISRVNSPRAVEEGGRAEPRAPGHPPSFAHSGSVVHRALRGRSSGDRSELVLKYRGLGLAIMGIRDPDRSGPMPGSLDDSPPRGGCWTSGRTPSAMIDPRVASGLRDIPPSVMIPRERMLATLPQDVRLVRLSCRSRPRTSSAWRS